MKRPTAVLVLVILLALTHQPGSARAAGAQDALLTLQDMPRGWAVRPTASDLTAGTTLCDKTRLLTGRDQPFGSDPEVEASVAFQRSASGPLLYQVVVLAPEGTGSALMDGLRDLLQPCAWEQTTRTGDRAQYELSELSFPDLGDESIAMRLHIDEGVVVGEADYIAIRRGDAITLLAHATFGFAFATVDSDLTEQFARRADAKLAELPEQPR